MTNENSKQAQHLCLHCATPVSVPGKQFCCLGCDYVYRSIHALGLASFYSLPKDSPDPTASDVVPEKDFSYLEDPLVKEKIVTTLKNGAESVQFYLPTIHCAACVWLLEKIPQAVPGVINARVTFNNGQISIVYNPEVIRLPRIAAILNSIGYPPVPATRDAIASSAHAENRGLLRRIGIAAVCAANTMMLAASLFQGFFSGMEHPYSDFFRWMSALIALPAVLYCALPFYRSAIGALVVGSFHIDLPISIAIVAGYIAGIISTARGDEYIYFDSICTLTFLLLISRYVQRRALFRARASTKTSWDLFPSTVRCREGERIIVKPFRELQVGDVVIVSAGEPIPSDGVIVEGRSSIDSSFLTGEALPTTVQRGTAVLGGAINLEASLTVRIELIGIHTRIGKILALLEHGEGEKTELENEANRLSGRFVAIVLCLAVLTFTAWQIFAPARAFDVTISLLIVTCPCALGLAIPVTSAISLARAQRCGIFVKRPGALQTLAHATHFYFDKTGTLTQGTLSVTSTSIAPELRPIVKALAEGGISHPASRAVVDFLSGVDGAKLSQIRQVAGRGVEGVLADGRLARLGSWKWAESNGAGVPPQIKDKVAEGATKGSSSLLFSIGESVCGMFALEDRLAPTAREIITKLQRRGKKVFILSGDSQAAVTHVAHELSIPPEQALGERYPDEKASIIVNSPGVRAMIGDGLNDSLALRSSDVGIGLRGGIEATLESADIFTAKGGLAQFVKAYEGALRTQAVVKRNLRFSLVYNIFGATSACLGFVNPLFAALLMPLSSLTVILSSLSSTYFREDS